MSCNKYLNSALTTGKKSKMERNYGEHCLIVEALVSLRQINAKLIKLLCTMLNAGL